MATGQDIKPTENTMGQTGTALALRTQAAALDAYTPRDLNEAFTLAKHYAASKILGSYGTTEQVMLVMATGSELGIPPTAALRSIYVVEGRVFMSSDLMVALCLRAPQCERFDLTEQTNESAAYTVQRDGGQPIAFRFTLEDAKVAGLGAWNGKEFKDGSNWRKYPGVMCRHRAAALAARAVFPDVILGMYEDGERDEITAREVTAPPVQPLTPAAEVADAEIVEGDETRIVRQLGEAQTMDQVGALAAEAQRIWPAVRPESVKQAHKDAKKRIAQAATAGLVTPAREPGED